MTSNPRHLNIRIHDADGSAAMTRAARTKSRRRDKPIIFSAPMVRALLDGRKTQTRRVIRDVIPNAPTFDNVVHKPRHAAPYLDAYCGERKTAESPRGMGQNWCWWTRDDRCGSLFRVGYMPGDRLWVRERTGLPNNGGIKWPTYMADDAWMKNGIVRVDPARLGDKPRSSIHMPRWASRLTLTVTDGRVQRLQEISEEDAWQEGVDRRSRKVRQFWLFGADQAARERIYKQAAVWEYEDLWNALHGPNAWAANPWVVALTFTVEQRNIDALREAA